MNLCSQHSGHDERIKAAEKAVGDLWKAVSSIRGWVIAGMSSTILATMAFILDTLSKRIP